MRRTTSFRSLVLSLLLVSAPFGSAAGHASEGPSRPAPVAAKKSQPHRKLAGHDLGLLASLVFFPFAAFAVGQKAALPQRRIVNGKTAPSVNAHSRADVNAGSRTAPRR